MMQSQTSFPGKPKLLDQLRTFMRARRYSLRTEEAYLDWRVNALLRAKDPALHSHALCLRAALNK
jgi:hypothetical protein